jgi:Transposase domain (DUF772)
MNLGHAMMGERRVVQEALFYGFSLERHVPDNNLLRKIDRFVDLSEVRTHLEPYYSETGRPSIDPELMMRMLIIGYCFGFPIRPDLVSLRDPPDIFPSALSRHRARTRGDRKKRLREARGVV